MSIEPITIPPTAERRIAIGTLSEALRFTQADLAENRAGRISDSQRDQLTIDGGRIFRIGIAALIGIGFLAALALFAGAQNRQPVLTLIGITLTILNAGIMGFIVRNRLRLSDDVRNLLMRDQGVINHTVRIVGGRTATYLLDFHSELGTERLLVPKNVFFAFEEGQSYALYRTAASKTLLAAELNETGAT